MRKIVLCATAAFVLIYAGCGNLGEDPLPFPGFKDDNTVVLFRNGTLFNFDYTAEYDGIQSSKYEPEAPDGSGGTFWSLSTNIGSAGYFNDITKVRNTRAMEFKHDEPGNYDTEWMFTLFDTPPITISKYGNISFWVFYANPVKPGAGSQQPSAVTIDLISASGISVLKNGYCAIGNDIKEAGKWHKFEVDINNIPEWLPQDDILWRWTISVPVNAGRIFVDEFILHPKQ